MERAGQRGRPETNPVTMSDLHFLQEFLRDDIQDDQAVDSARQADQALAAVREILTLRGNTAALVRVTASSRDSWHTPLPRNSEE